MCCLILHTTLQSRFYPFHRWGSERSSGRLEVTQRGVQLNLEPSSAVPLSAEKPTPPASSEDTGNGPLTIEERGMGPELREENRRRPAGNSVGMSLTPQPHPTPICPPGRAGRGRGQGGRPWIPKEDIPLALMGWLRSHPGAGPVLPSLPSLFWRQPPFHPSPILPPSPPLSAQTHHLLRPWLSESPGKAAFFETGRCPQVSGRKNSQAEPTKTVSKGPGLAPGQD